MTGCQFNCSCFCSCLPTNLTNDLMENTRAADAIKDIGNDKQLPAGVTKRSCVTSFRIVGSYIFKVTIQVIDQIILPFQPPFPEILNEKINAVCDNNAQN